MSEPVNIIALTREELESLLEQAAERAAKRVSAANRNHNGNSHDDDWLTPAQAAAEFDVSVKWIYRHARKWRFVERLSRKKLRISYTGLRRWAQARGHPLHGASK